MFQFITAKISKIIFIFSFLACRRHTGSSRLIMGSFSMPPDERVVGVACQRFLLHLAMTHIIQSSNGYRFFIPRGTRGFSLNPEEVVRKGPFPPPFVLRIGFRCEDLTGCYYIHTGL